MRFQQPQLEPLRSLVIERVTHTPGQAYLSAASGLVCAFGCAYVVADDEHHLAMFKDRQAPGRLLQLFDGDLPSSAKKRKRRKPDTETLALLPAHDSGGSAALLALGSGSKPQRCLGKLIGLSPQGEPMAGPRTIDLQPLYAPLASRFGELNVEGAFVASGQGGEFVLLQRGHRGGVPSASVHYRLQAVQDWLQGRAPAPQPHAVREHALGTVDDTPLSFTDGCALPDGRWLFTAVAEASDDAIADGPCLASAVGLMSADHQRVAMLALLRREKVEGIAARRFGRAIELRLVTDHDDPARPSQLLRATLVA